MATLNNPGLFGTQTRTNTLLVIHLLGETHASEIAPLLGKSLSRIQASIDSLERTGVVIGIEEGNTRRVRLNPRFLALPELSELLNKMVQADVELQQTLASRRRRPRRSGKKL
jgi:DNA-binding transcriptional ArsR family regulator